MHKGIRLILLDEGLFIGADAKVSRNVTIEWPASPEELGTKHHRYLYYNLRLCF